MAFFGTFANYSALPNVGTDVGSTNLAVGDTANVDTQAYQCVVAGPYPGAVWEPVGVAGVVTRSYGDTTLAFIGSAAPTNLGAAFQACVGSGGNTDLVNYFDASYFRCVVHLRAVDSGGAVVAETTQRFADFNAVLAWVNTNVPVTAGLFDAAVAMSVYDEVDGSIVMPPKVYGKNRFWAGMRSRAPYPERRYWTSPANSCIYADANPRRTVFAEALEAAWGIIFGPGFIQPAAGWGPKEFGCNWLGVNRLRRYDMPAFNASALSVTNAGPYRFVQEPGPSTTAPTLAPWDYFGGIAYIAIDPSCTTWTAFSINESFTQLAQRILEGYSVMVVYGLFNPGTLERATLVKPAGIDQLYFDWYDPTLCQLEVVGRTRLDFHPRIRVLTPLGFDAQRRTAGPVDIPQLRDAIGATGGQERTGIVGRHNYTTGGARFQLRRLLDGRVSPLTTARLAPTIRRRARPWVLQVIDGLSI